MYSGASRNATTALTSHTPAQSVFGMHDLMAEQHARHKFVTDTACKVARAYGCQEISTPLLERADVFRRTLGSDSDVVCGRLVRLNRGAYY